MNTNAIVAKIGRHIACGALATVATLSIGLNVASASPLTAPGCVTLQPTAPNQRVIQLCQPQSGNGSITVNPNANTNVNSGVQNRGSNNGRNTGSATTSGTGNNTANRNQVQGNGNTIVGGGNNTQANNANNVNGSNNTVTNVTGVGNTVNSNNKTVTNVNQFSSNTTIVEQAAPQVVVVQQAAPAPAAPTTVVVTTDVGLSIDKGLGGVYYVGDQLGIGYTVSRPMQVEIALVMPNNRTTIYKGIAEGPGNITTFAPTGVGIYLIEVKAIAEDGSAASEAIWFQVSE